VTALPSQCQGRSQRPVLPNRWLALRGDLALDLRRRQYRRRGAAAAIAINADLVEDIANAVEAAA